MCTRSLEESIKKMRFKFVFEPIQMINCTNTAWQPIPKMRATEKARSSTCFLTRGTSNVMAKFERIPENNIFTLMNTKLKI